MDKTSDLSLYENKILYIGNTAIAKMILWVVYTLEL